MSWGDAVLDGERVKLKDTLEDGLDLVVREVLEVNPEEESLVGADEAQGLDREVLAGELAVTEDKGADHGRGPVRPGRRVSPRSRE